MPETQDWSSPQQSPATLIFATTLTCTEGGTVAIISGGIAGNAINVVRMGIAALGTGFGVNQQVRDVTSVRLRDTVTLNSLAIVNISPETPYAETRPGYGAGATGVGNGITAIGTTRAGSGACQVSLVLEYYLSR